MKQIICSIIILLFLGCNFIENKKKEKIRNDSIVHARIEFVQDSTRTADSIKHINDSITKANVEIERINKIKSSLRVSSCYLSAPNSAGGCDANFYYVNKSNKTIKYIIFDASFKNDVDDIVMCDIRNSISFRGKDTGPIKPGNSGGGSWDCVIYNWSATKMVVNSIDIDYMDGSSISISGKDLKLIGLKDKQINM